MLSQRFAVGPLSKARSASVLVMLALGWLAVGTGPASAASVSVSGNVLAFVASPGEANQVRLATWNQGSAGEFIEVTDNGPVLSVGSGCTPIGPDGLPVPPENAHSANCGTFSSATVSLGDMDDSAGMGGAQARVTLTGGDGDDSLGGGPLADEVIGGSGNDRIDGGAGGDRIQGGADVDTVDYARRVAPLSVSLDGLAPDDGEGGEGDNLAADIERVLGGSGDDELVGNASANLLDGAAGDDLLDGAAGPDELVGGPGADRADYSSHSASVTVDLGGTPGGDGGSGEGDTVGSDVEDVWGGSGNDALTGSYGDNLLYGGAGADVLKGLGGADLADYSDRQAGVSVALDGASNDGNGDDGPAGARDNIALDVEDAVGGAGNDTLVGNGGENLLLGGPGADAILGGDGEDLLLGEAGDDRLNSRDSSADGVTCGDGSDGVAADGLDEVLGDCESILLPGGPPPARDTSAPLLSVSPRGGQNLKTVLSRGLVVTFGCSEACTIKGQLLLDTRVAKRFKLAAVAKTITVGRGSGRLARAGKVRVAVKLTRKARRQLGRARKLTLTLSASATDKAGNQRRVRRKVTLRRSAKAGAAGLQTGLELQSTTRGSSRALRHRVAIANRGRGRR